MTRIPRDITGQRSGKLVAVAPTEQRKRKRILWLCRCDCGGEILCNTNAILNRDNTSCGCGTRNQNDHLREFIERQANNAGCWEWKGFRDRDGYGRAKFNGITTVAHRAIYRLVVGEIPEGMNLCHRCDNPSCCRPDHMFIGTQRDNCLDAKEQDRHSRGTRNGQAKLTDDIVRAIRASSETQWTLARRYGVRQAVISGIKRREKWAHVQD